MRLLPRTDIVQVLKLAGAALAIAAVLHVVGDRRMTARLRTLERTFDEAASLADARMFEIGEWTEAPDVERARGATIHREFAGAVSAHEVRMTFAQEVTELAARCGIDGVSLLEVARDGMAYADPWSEGGWDDGVGGDRDDTSWDDDGGGDDWNDDGWSDGDDGGGGQGPPPGPALVPYEFQVSFAGTWDSMIRFLDGLSSLNRVVDARAAVVRREAPWVRVELTLVAYARDEEAT